MEPQIVFVLSTNYSGSHFLALQLASHSRCTSLGELYHSQRPAARRLQFCFTCPDEKLCPVFGGLEGVPARQLFQRVFENITAMNPAVTTGIDNSKKVEWARRFVGLKGFGLKYIHLVRDPRALVRRWTLSYETEREKAKVRRLTARRCWRHFFDILRGPEDNVYAHKWAYQNRQISRFIQRHGLDAKVVTYDDLVHYPQRVLSDLMGWLGLEFEPGQIQYWDVHHHGTHKPQYMKAPPGGKPQLDLRWREFLSEQVQRRVCSNPEVTAFLTEQSIQFTPTGLTLHPDWEPAADMSDGSCDSAGPISRP